jgi:hypothetical protein
MAAVRLSPLADAEFQAIGSGNDELSVKRFVHLQRYFKEFCESRIPRLNDEKFRKEIDGVDSRGRPIAIWAFKPWKWRLYGAILQVAGKKCFVGVRVDPSKKQNKANKGLMNLAVEDIARLAEYTGR